MIYGYLRVSSDEQDINSQRQGVEKFALEKKWTIDEYISDEGVSGGKDPNKRKLGPLLKKLTKGDIIIASEISRLGRDLYMVMDILHFCMETECVIYTVKDNFVLGSDVQSKVLAFAFGLSAEIERQMIRQRTKEGLKLRMKMGVLLGRPIGTTNSEEVQKFSKYKEDLKRMLEWGVPVMRIAKNIGCDRNTVPRLIIRWNYEKIASAYMTTNWAKTELRDRNRNRVPTYKDEPYKIVSLDRNRVLNLIKSDMTIPEIQQKMSEFTYEQIYDTILCDSEFNNEYRKHAQIILKNKRFK